MAQIDRRQPWRAQRRDHGCGDHRQLLRGVAAVRQYGKRRLRAHHPALGHPVVGPVFLNGLSAPDFRNLLHMLQTEKPVYWDNDRFVLRTAHPQSHDAEPVGDQEAHASGALAPAPADASPASHVVDRRHLRFVGWGPALPENC
ncbi:MAG: hypothetical protein MZU95_10420 [Desulfomicrobium escambiense]|nr:hypothetical protein [Desulfomicrobium escambiense]